MAVMNMAEEMVDVWKAVFMTYAPAHSSHSLIWLLRTLGSLSQRCMPGCLASS